MREEIAGGRAVVYTGDCLEVMQGMEDASVDSIVTDPPYLIGFMGKSWDAADGIAGRPDVWCEALRVLKPGGHMLCFGGSRTFHRVAVAIEDAGFEIRDTLMWIYGSGFPKSFNVGKVLPEWDGYGSALKPAHEPIILARKPLDGTIANNVLMHGVGALNIDACRVPTNWESDPSARGFGYGFNKPGSDRPDSAVAMGPMTKAAWEPTQGRFPANVIHDGSPEVLDAFAAFGEKTTNPGKCRKESAAGMYGPSRKAGTVVSKGSTGTAARFFKACEWTEEDGDVLGASRFIYAAKASKRDRDEGLEGMEERATTTYGEFQGTTNHSPKGAHNTRRNIHPTVKPQALMSYLVKLITPPNGMVLDPFMGSGSTGKAAMLEGFRFIGIEREEEYVTIGRARIEHAWATRQREEMKGDERLPL